MSDLFFDVDLIDPAVSADPIPVDLAGRLPTAEEFARIVDDELHGTMEYEPIIVSPAEYADPKFRAALKESFPRGRLVFRPRRR